MKKSEEGRRWDYLFKLEKLKRMKLDETRRLKDMNEYEKDLNDCTFSPKLNINKMDRVNSGIGNNLTITNAMRGQKSQIRKVNSNGDNSVALNEGTNLIDRQKAWEYKKFMKIENIKQIVIEKDTAECVFTPKLVKLTF
jgi:hypothetical protein